MDRIISAWIGFDKHAFCVSFLGPFPTTAATRSKKKKRKSPRRNALCDKTDRKTYRSNVAVQPLSVVARLQPQPPHRIFQQRQRRTLLLVRQGEVEAGHLLRRRHRRRCRRCPPPGSRGIVFSACAFASSCLAAEGFFLPIMIPASLGSERRRMYRPFSSFSASFDPGESSPGRLLLARASCCSSRTTCLGSDLQDRGGGGCKSSGDARCCCYHSGRCQRYNFYRLPLSSSSLRRNNRSSSL